MKITKEIDELLKKRTEHGEELHRYVCEVDRWLVEHGADLLATELQDHTQTGVLIYTEPIVSEMAVRKYIEENM